MNVLKVNNIFVIILSAIFLLTGNVVHSLAYSDCNMEECCKEVCCVENIEIQNSDITYSEQDCCEYNQNYEVNSKAIYFQNNTQKNLDGFTKQPLLNSVTWSQRPAIPFKPATNSASLNLIVILRI